MALVSPSSPATFTPEKSDSENAPASSAQIPEMSQPFKSTETPLSSSVQPLPTQASSSPSITETPNSNPNPINLSAPSIPSINPQLIPGAAPSYRPPVPAPVPSSAPQFSPLLPNPPTIQPPGVGGNPPVTVMLPGVVSGAGAVTVSVSSVRPPGMYPYAPGQLPNPPPATGPYAQMPNGYPTAPGTTDVFSYSIFSIDHGGKDPAGFLLRFLKDHINVYVGIPRYPSPYVGMVRPTFPPRPPAAIGAIPPLSRPPVPGIRPPIVPPVIRPVVPIVATTEKPQTTVYVGKISSTVENEFLLSLLQLCGPVKSWKRAQDPSNGAPRGFGFCEFESAEGVLRALRLLSKFCVDGLELVLNVNQATKGYLERYVEKKTEREKKLKEGDSEGAEKEDETAPGVEKREPQKTLLEESKKDEDDSTVKENQYAAQSFGIVTDEDREADRDVLEKLKSMVEERLKTKPPPPPPVQNLPDGSSKSNSEMPAKSRDGDSNADILKSAVFANAAEDKNDDETTSDSKHTTEQEKPETSSSDKARRYDRSRERDRERDLKKEKERELERYERERERERIRREREREMKIREAERLYKERVKEWESRERDKEHQRVYEKEKEKERERDRRREIMDQEDESDDDDSRKRRRRSSSSYEDKRRRRQREKEDDLEDRLREEEEIAEAKRRAAEEEKQREDSKSDSKTDNRIEQPVMSAEAIGVEDEENSSDVSSEKESCRANSARDAVMQNGTGEELAVGSAADSDLRQNGNNAPARKLGFGITSSGKRTAVPSVFHEEDDEDAHKEKKMRPLVPIDYSTEELKAVQPAVSGTPPNLAAAAEFAKRISSNPKEDRVESDRERNRRSNERSGQRDRDRNDDEGNRARDENKEKVHDRILDRDRDREHATDKMKPLENKKLLDAKQLIDMIPKTKEELFSYDINWAIYDKHDLHERMRPWISKKITEFLGEEEASLVDYIVSSTKEHVRASQMLELLQSILDDEAEMFVLKMWRMLIFEIKKVETGLDGYHWGIVCLIVELDGGLPVLIEVLLGWAWTQVLLGIDMSHRIRSEFGIAFISHFPEYSLSTRLLLLATG
ncbi:hypothetical protein ACLOJK_031142 [Asimina triloba]